MANSTDLLGPVHKDTNIEEVLRSIRRDPFAYCDTKKRIRKVPIFVYENGTPVAIARWQERRYTEDWEEAKAKLLDFYHETRGWIREGKKAERDFDFKPDFPEEL